MGGMEGGCGYETTSILARSNVEEENGAAAAGGRADAPEDKVKGTSCFVWCVICSGCWLFLPDLYCACGNVLARNDFRHDPEDNFLL